MSPLSTVRARHARHDAAETHRGALEATRPQKPVALKALRGGGIYALVAEDNPINQTLIRRMLEKLGCRVCVAENGREAVAAVKAERFDIVFMDWRMPEMDGLEATRTIRKIQGLRPIPIVAVTANATDGDRETCIAAGVDEYLVKPVKAKHLQAMIERFVTPRASAPGN